MLALSTVIAVLSGCIVGPNYAPPTPTVPDTWRSLTSEDPLDELVGTVRVAEAFPDQLSMTSECLPLSSLECPWWQEFVDPDLVTLIGLQQAKSPTLHEVRARVNEAWHQRWVLKQGFFPQFSLSTGRSQNILDSAIAAGSEDYQNTLRADMGWELDLFGGRQRQVEAADRNIESQVESWRGSHVFLVGEVGLYYTDYRVALERIELQKSNVTFYEEMRQTVVGKFEFGNVAEIEVKQTDARLQREKAALPRLLAARDNAKNELARVVGVYVQELDTLLTPGLPVPTPSLVIDIPPPARVLRTRPDIRQLERKVAQQVANIGVAVSSLYPEISLDYSWNGGDAATDVIRHAFVLGGEITKRIIAPDREKERIWEQEAGLQRELWNFDQGLITAASEVENAIVDVQRANEQIYEQQLAVNVNRESLARVYEGFRKLPDYNVQDIIRIRTELFNAQLELLAARNLLAKATLRLYKSIGGIDIPPIPERMILSPHAVKDYAGTNHFLSRLFSLDRDRSDSLHTNRQEARRYSAPWYHITPNGILKPGPPPEAVFLNRSWFERQREYPQAVQPSHAASQTARPIHKPTRLRK